MRESIAVIATCHNRRAFTVRAVRAALDQDADASVSVFVVDDGSTDGTAEALADLGEDVTVLQGSGSLYWAAGMALAERAAMRADPDYLLWLNDDTFLDPDAVTRMLQTAVRHPGAIVVGATRDPLTAEVTYGGRLRTSTWHPQRFRKLPAAATDQFADTINGNAVLIPRAVRRRVGPIDGRFPHAYADDDYGLRARKLGVPLVQAPGTVAECTLNPPPTRYVRGVSAWRELQQPKGLPWRAQVRFLRRHAGTAWPLVFLGQQVNVLVGRQPVGTYEGGV